MSEPGTLEIAAVEFSKLLRPLATDTATPTATKQFFASMGITLTDAQVAAISGNLTPLANDVSDLLPLIHDLVEAIDAAGDQTATIVAKGIEAIAKIADIISKIGTLGSALAGIGGLSAEAAAARLFDFLLYGYLQRTPEVNDVLDFAGILDREEHDDFTIPTYHFGAVGDWLSDPSAKVKSLYHWGENNFDGKALFSRAERILAGAGLPVIYDETGPRLDVVFLELRPKTDVNPHGLLLGIRTDIASFAQTIQLGDDARAELKADFTLPKNMGVAFTPDGKVAFLPPSPGQFGGDVTLKAIAERTAPPAPFILFGQAGGSRLEMGKFTLTLGTHVANANGSFLVQGDVDALKVKIDTSSGDGFLAKILPGTNVDADFNLQVGVSSSRGFYFNGSSALEVRLPAHIELGPVSIEALTIGAKLQNGKIPVSVGADIKAALGPLVAVVQNMGVTATFELKGDRSGNLGPLDFGVGFKPPTGVGLSIDTGVIKGGGFLSLDFDKGEYFGSLELSFQDVITLKAVGIINTKMPDGSKGFALLILVTAEFTPIQLGFGFTLNGVGGLLALNRTLETEALRTGVRTGAIESILFPPDVVGNISKIISDLKTFFPLAQEHFVIGPMGKLGWGTPTLITLELGVILDIPKPEFVILGIIRCILPAEDAPILKLQVNFAGGIDFSAKLIWFDASLFDSRLLIYTLAGDMALRIGWGEPAVLVISVGGFHPAFKEIPTDLRSMKRMSISLLSGDNPRLSVMTYFAITSNTVQSGAKAELYAEACGFNLYGFMGYDFLVQFSPFHFIADIYAGLALRHHEDVLAGVSVECKLSGPTPWNANGEATLTILFFDISVGFDVTWGDDGPAQIEQTVDVLDLVTKALQDDRNWLATFPANTHNSVTLKKIDMPSGTIVLHPFGVLSVSQKVAPLGTEINKFGNRKPAGATKFDLTSGVGGTDTLKEEFGMANFLRLSDSDKLSRPSFERLPSGLRFATGDASASGAQVQKDVSYELSYVHRKLDLIIRAGIMKIFGSVFSMFVKGSAATASVYSVSKKNGATPPSKIAVADGGYSVVNVSDLSPAGPGMVAATATEAYLLHDQLVAANPSLRGKVQVVSAWEVN
jgi:hypothetical protein